jgi:phosphoglucosamine mutase
LVNVKVKEKRPFEQIPGLNDTIELCRKELGENGRLLVRYSGTEKLARIMVEARKTSEIFRITNLVARVIQDAVGEGK